MAHTLNTSEQIVCLGGGIGTVNLIKGLKEHTRNITVVVSAADDGGSAGRLRRLYNIFPPGDAISCLAALLPEDRSQLADLLTYRFPGNRYAKDGQLAGHKLGNLLFVAAKETTGGAREALGFLEKLFQTSGKVLPATEESLSLSARTVEGLEVDGEEKIDLGKYKGKRILDSVSIKPANPAVPREVVTAIKNASLIIAGPGDLYTTILPVLVIPEIKSALLESKAKKIYVVNVANKPFETKGYHISEYTKAVTKHLGSFPFQTVIANSNTSLPIPNKYKYKYVKPEKQAGSTYKLLLKDLVSEDFSLYHDSKKLARVILNEV